MSSPKISILALNYPPETTGIAPYTGSLAVALAELGYPVVVNVAQPHYPEWKIRGGYRSWSRFERVRGVDVQRRLHYVPNPPRGLRRLVSELSFGIRLLFGWWGPKGIVIAVSPALFAVAIASLRRGRLPFVVWVQDIYALGLSETREGGALAARVTARIESWVLRRADHVVVIHERMADIIVTSFGVDRDRVTVIRNWTHLPEESNAEKVDVREQLGWSADETIILHAGNMGAKQGLANVVEAARLADSREAAVRFILLGDGGEREKLIELAEGIERIEFMEALPEKEFSAVLAAADVLVVNELPGVAHMAMPSKLTSYFAVGRPVVAATDADGITASEIEHANAGLVVPAADPAALLDAALLLRGDPIYAERLGANGFAHCKSVLAQLTATSRWESLILRMAERGSS